ncbi:hypothetical protein [uncultured Pantoea sp.]|uniref:hypothetical protein n=1 Tax=uncultured Pantoea sp. TaxID=218084 RepID=UPI0020708A38|nr:hypothetical protein [uncultured Pantoea sp.]DAL43507.1 MAG TPA_asm: hypothetical protein [Caudoviricetes sp.]
MSEPLKGKQCIIAMTDKREKQQAQEDKRKTFTVISSSLITMPVTIGWMARQIRIVQPADLCIQREEVAFVAQPAQSKTFTVISNVQSADDDQSDVHCNQQGEVIGHVRQRGQGNDSL